MNTSDRLKDIVRDKYGQIASQKQSSCCGPQNTSCCAPTDIDYSMFSESYEKLSGYNSDADLGLGCGLPTEFAAIKKGDTVLDLGSGAGNDVFVARSLAGENGRVIGVDMTPEMIEKAEANQAKLGFKNIEFHLAEIENMPLADNEIDVVISNCVLNLVPDKSKAFKEMYRVIKPGGHFCISDVVIRGKLPERLQESAELYAGCVAGALDIDDYLSVIEQAGFKNIEVKKEKQIVLPDDLLKQFLNSDDMEELKKENYGIFSITVVAYK